jgi:hypothetical protein
MSFIDDFVALIDPFEECECVDDQFDDYDLYVAERNEAVVKKAKSSFFDRVAEAHEEHKGDETRLGGGGDLPAGIEHGVARLVDCRIGVYQKGDNQGEPFFMASGTVLDPAEVVQVDPKTKKSRKISIRGLRTSIGPEPLCDTTKANGDVVSLADHWDRVLNHLRLLGIDTKDIEPSDVVAEGDDDYASGPILEALVESAPTFRFRTWQSKPTPQYPDPRTNHEWRGLCDYDEEGGTANEVDDESGETEWESDEEEEKKPAKKAPVKKGKPTKVEEPEEVEEEEAEEGEVDYGTLAAVADAGKPKKAAEDAARVLSDKAKELGIAHWEDIPTWTELATAIVEAGGEEEGGEAEEEEAEEEEWSEEDEEWTPVADEIAFMSNGPKKKPTEVEITKVYAKAEKADVKRLDTNKILKGVPFAKLSSEDSPF